ncbi:hypothetical protein C8Q79DRAFT_916281 [Trametes meyenii]|nr:hypothetical protein C8Q79DRAFT_916281 [Trametes meyenii]
MGQANSRTSPVSRPQPSSSAASPTALPSANQSPQRDGVGSVTPPTPSSSKTSRRSTVRRTVRGLLRPRTQSDAPPSSTSSTQISSFRKRWRSSRRFSKARASLPNLSETLHEADKTPVPSATAVDAQVLAADDQPTAIVPSSSAPILSVVPLASCPTASRSSPVEFPAEPDTEADAAFADDRSSSDDHSLCTAPEQPSTSLPDLPKLEEASPHQAHPERVAEIERELTDFLLERPHPDSLFVEGSSQDGQPSDASNVPLSRPASSPAEAQDSTVDTAQQQQQQQQPAPRHFPPPGTLVVVQGVVNTSDSPSSSHPSPSPSNTRPSSIIVPVMPSTVPVRRRSSSVPRAVASVAPEERPSARSRLSAFIPRPSSMLRRRSSTSEPAVLHHSRSSSDVSSAAFDSATSEDSSEDISDPSSSVAAADQRASGGGDGDPTHARPLSPGSIDVLGTLLSVAAAATAASLFSPSLGFQANADTPAPAAPAPPIPRPMSPTPTAGLGGGPAFSTVPDLVPDVPPLHPHAYTNSPVPAPQREGRERIRNVWESFRERLGLNRAASSPTSGAGLGGASNDTNTQDAGTMRPGELMLAEMARALNVGLGLTGDGTSAGDRQQQTEEGTARTGTGADGEGVGQAAEPVSTPSARSPPPEDSFERFLLNLQADLRIALSESGVGAAASASATSPAAANASSEHHARGPSAEDILAHASYDHEHEDGPTRADGDEGELPPLQDVSDSESEDAYDEMEFAGEDDDGPPSSERIATPMPPARGLSPSPRSGSTGIDAEDGRAEDEPQADADGEAEAERRPPGIHLWRLYRFRPIHAHQIAGHAAATTSPIAPAFPQGQAAAPHPPSQPPSPSAPASIPAAHPSHSTASRAASPSPLYAPSAATAAAATVSPAAADGADSPSLSAPPATDPNANMVVPVIVVGLQSVEMGQVHGHARDHTHTRHRHHAHADSRARRQESDGAPPYDDLPFDDGGRGSNSAPGSDSDPPARGRSWQSRAATALRNLRPGRRNGSRGQQAAEGSGSRTFLIYVIGGYYPPNHHMVTGPDNLDSYEALWELAELLGSVKPQVATREDIEKSDLQTIKFSELEQYEREGRVASNCVDRCLICLDDYQSDDDVRLMHCRHAFHKECVDKWLQVGRNNCPACRTKGVSTADEVTP